jgi:2-desacetyl-2-hydroxyethyl bacteriochlorophyllide A dehydrogenase
MRAFVITGPHRAEVQDVEPPVARAGEVIVDVDRAGVCGTDAEFFSGQMSYLHTGQAAFPLRIGHEWVGTVVTVGPQVDSAWIGRRVTGDTMLGCRHCERCRSGRQHLCADRYEIGIRNGWPGALAEQLVVPVVALHVVPDSVDATAGAMVEPGANALRSVDGAALAQGERLLVLGTGTIGLLVAKIAAARGVEVHLLGRSEETLDFPRSLGFRNAWVKDTLPQQSFDAVVDASNAQHLPALAAELVEPGGRVVYIGISEQPSLLDTRTLVLADVTAVGILSGSGALTGTIELYASGAVDPRPLVGDVVGLDDVGEVLASHRHSGWGPPPKIHVDPRK